MIFSNLKQGRVKSSAMFYALFLMTIVSIVIAGLFQLSDLNKQLASKFEIQEILVKNSKSGLAYGQAYFLELSQKEMTVRLFDQGIDSVVLSKKNWGAYQILKSKAVHQDQSFSKMVLVGSLAKTKLPNLYLADQGRPLSLTGKTKIEGSCKLPEAGVKRAYISGENYQGDKLIYGQKENSGKQLPQINDELILNLNLIEGEKLEWDNTLPSYYCPFDSLPVHFVSDAPIFIGTQSFSGQIIIESKDSIVISSQAQLEDVIIKSPKIIIESGFRGNIQCLASDGIIVEESVILEYPSVLGVVQLQQKEKPSFISIQSQSKIIGSVFILSEVQNFRKPVKLLIEKESVVHGLVFSQGQTELKGRVNGSIFTQSFYLKTASSVYQNHLLNAEITNQLPKEFIPIPLLESSNKIKIIQWLN